MDNNIVDALKEKVKLKCTVCGVGNAGSQFVDAAYKAGFRNVFCINSSSKDMDNDVLNADIPCFLVGSDGRGAGMNRNAAKELFKMNYRHLFENQKFVQYCEESDVIVIGTSCSGGTGSGISPIVVKAVKQMYPNKIVMFYGILPRLTSSDVELSNAMACVAEIEELNKSGLGIPYMLADLNYYEGISNEVAFVKVVEKMVTDIKVIAGDYLNYSKYRMIDENDMKVICLLTNMDIPLGNNIGNSVEVLEAINSLYYNPDNNLMKLCIELSSYMVKLGLDISYEEAKNKVNDVISNKMAYNKLLEFIKYQGGDVNLLPRSQYVYDVKSEKQGYLTSIYSLEVAKLSSALGAGRMSKDDNIDYSAGIIFEKGINDIVNVGDTIMKLYANRQLPLIDVDKLFTISDKMVENVNLIYEVIE